MSKITDPDQLSVGTELTIDLAAKTFTLNVAGNLVAKDGCSVQALYSKLVELWTTSTYNKYPFPGYVVGDPRAGMFVFGFDGSEYNGWKPGNADTRTYLRDGGWSEYSAAGVLNRVHVCVVSLGDCNSGAQLYYQKESGGAAISTTFADECNEALQVYGDSSNGNFDHRDYFQLFVREYGYKYAAASLTTIGETAAGPWKIGLPLSNEPDLKVADNDATVEGNSTYTGITVTYYASNQNRTVNGVSYPFRVIINGNGATAEQIYTKIQYLLRQNSDIDSGAGTVVGKTADALLRFVGDTLYTTHGVYIDSYANADKFRLVFTDQNGVERQEPFVPSGTLEFSAFLASGGTGYYRMFFEATPDGDYGEATAVTVNDASGNPIAGVISAASIPWTFNYLGNVQGGRTAGADANVVIVAGNPGAAKPVVAYATIRSADNQAFSVTAEQDRGYAT
jgi:hypothetical protein